MTGADYLAYWTGYHDAFEAYGYPLWVAIHDAEPDWHEQDWTMLAALNAA